MRKNVRCAFFFCAEIRPEQGLQMHLRAGLMFGNRGSRTKQRNNAKLKKEKRDSPKQRWGKENRNGMTSALQDFYAGRTFEGKLDRRRAGPSRRQQNRRVYRRKMFLFYNHKRTRPIGNAAKRKKTMGWLRIQQKLN